MNVACGVHAGDPTAIARTVAQAARLGLAIGAHPGFADREGHGRHEQGVAPADLEANVLWQVGAVAAFVRAEGLQLAHVKLHGALYHQAARDPALAAAVVRATGRFAPDVQIVGPATINALRAACAAEGLPYIAEAFADRAYRGDGTLVPRGTEGAVFTDTAAVVAQARQIVLERCVRAQDGSVVPIDAQTLCLHGDTPGAVAHARAVRDALVTAGVVLAPPT